MKSVIETVDMALADAARAEAAMLSGELRLTLRTEPALALSCFGSALPEAAPVQHDGARLAGFFRSLSSRAA